MAAASARIAQSTSSLKCAIFLVSGVERSVGLGDQPRDAAHLGPVAGRPDDAFGAAVGDERAGEGEVVALRENGIERRARRRASGPGPIRR